MRALPLSTLLLASCASVRPSFDWRPETPIAWPDAGETPRVEVLFAYRGTDDATRERGFLRRVGELIVGKPELKLVGPFGLGVNGAGELLIADTGIGAVHRLDLATAEHTLHRGPEDSPLQTPIGLAVVPDGRFFVTDSTSGLVREFGADGAPLRAFGSAEEIGRPTGIAFDALAERLLVLDTTGCRLLAYDLEGEFLGAFGRRGSGLGEYNYPTGIALDGEGNVYVVDSLNFRVQVLSNDLVPLRAFGVVGSGPGTFAKPKGVAVDSEGHVYVVDSMFDNVQIFDGEGQLLLTICRSGSGLGQLFLPTAIAIDGRDRVFVADTGNGRIQVFQYHGASS